MSEVQLRQLLRDCLVQIEGADGSPAGSGFFIAPGYVLTCSHVLRRQAQNPVDVRWHDRLHTGEVVYASAPPRPGTDAADDHVPIWPEPDLAVIRLDADTAHPCVRLGSREPAEGSLMVAAGRRIPFGDIAGEFSSARLEYTGKFSYLMRLKNDRFGRGMSGGPVLDLSRGEVCGLAKLAGPEQDGYAVPSSLLRDLPAELADELIRAHDQYHGTNRAWARAQRPLWEAQPPADSALLAPDSEAELLGLLARLPGNTPELLAQLYRECAGTLVYPDSGPLRELRAVALRLAELVHERGRPHAVIIFAELLAARHPAIAAALRDWSTAEATRQGTRELLLDWRASRGRGGRQAGQATSPMSVVIQITPSDSGPDQYVYTIWRNSGDVVLVERENDPLELTEIKNRLRVILPVQLGQLSGDHVIVEFILPPELFDEPVHMWPVFRNPHILLGYRYPVVIRDWERFYEAEDRNHARLKWDWLGAQDSTPLHWLQCVDRRPAHQLYPWFEAKIERAAIGFPGPAGDYAEALSAALDSGIRVAAWRQTRCGGHDSMGNNVNTGPCDGMIFQQVAGEKVSAETVYWLPEKMKELRLSPGILSDGVLLWDNPHRGPHPRGLAVH
jgi:hypothetical protein